MKDYERQTQEIYNQMKCIWPQDNSWYDFTHLQILEFIYKYNRLFNTDDKVLNAGSGGTVYNIRGNMYHVDLATNLIKHLPNAYTSSIEKMPFPDGFFNSVICVGSVINYCNAMTAISEISRVMTKDSYLIIEYERSFTGELFFKSGYGKNIVKQVYDYNGQHNHNLWLYSDNYINQILKENGLQIIDSKLFHLLSSLKNRFINDEIKAGYASKYDKYLTKWFAYRIAHNRILLCYKSF